MRRKFLHHLFSTLVISTASLSLSHAEKAPNELKIPERLNSTERTNSGSKAVEATHLSALVYSPELTEHEVVERAYEDAQRFGFEVYRTLAIRNIVVVQGTVQQSREAIKHLEDSPYQAVWPVFTQTGVQTPDTLMVFSNCLVIEFSKTASETDKERFYARSGFERIREHASGHVLVRTPFDGGMEMYERASDLAQERIIQTVVPESVVVAQQTSSNSLEINDPLFELAQWSLWNSPSNSLRPQGTVGKADEDIDAPRAWMVNTNSSVADKRQNPFGKNTVTVSIFDGGVQDQHPDLAASIAANVGYDAIDGGDPRPPLTALGAHGNLMAGLVAAQPNNSIGVVGVSPGVEIYVNRVLGEDRSTTSATLRFGINDAIFNDIDISVHGYVLSSILEFTDDATLPFEQAFKDAFESGRGGFGMTTICSAGNFSSQVQYPAASPWTFAVGAVTSEGLRSSTSNWGGTGVDFVMPGFSAPSAGIVSTDLIGTVGIAPKEPNNPVNTSGDYGTMGSNAFTLGNTPSNFQGTSASAALAAGVVALLYSDSRFAEYAPFDLSSVSDLPDVNVDPSPEFSREIYRNRANVRPNDNNILATLKNFSDLPSVSQELENFESNRLKDLYEYTDWVSNFSYMGTQVNEFLGFGRPNASTPHVPGLELQINNIPFLAEKVSPVSGYETLLSDTPVYSVQFGDLAPPGESLKPEQLEALGKGWSVQQGVNLFIEGLGLEEPVTISPFLEGLDVLVFEDGTVLESEDGEEGPMLIYAWTDSLTTGSSETEDIDAFQNLLHNPNGRYLRSANLSLVSPTFGLAGVETPMMLKMQLAHELGTQNSSLDPDGVGGASVGEAGTPIQISQEIDPLLVSITYESEDDEIAPLSYEVARITGDSQFNPKAPLEQATAAEYDNSANEFDTIPQWRNAPDEWYDPFNTIGGGIDKPVMVIKPYNFLVPPPPPGYTSATLSIALQPGNSFLPEYSVDAQDGSLEAERITNIFRDHQGFIFYGADLIPFSSGAKDLFGTSLRELADGEFPNWSASNNEIIFTQGSVSGDFVQAADIDPLFYATPMDEDSLQNSPQPRPNSRVLEIFETVTGMDSHPTEEILAITTSTGSQDFVSLVTNDGVNLTRLVTEAEAIGARDPSWANNGSQLVFCTEESIQVLNFERSGSSFRLETVLDSTYPHLTDFRSPIFDQTAGFIYFVARKKAESASDDSLNLYLVSRSGRVISLGADVDGAPFPLLDEFQGIDLYDLELSRTGNRLLFVANAELNEPRSERGGAGFVSSPNANLFTVENIFEVASYDADPEFSQLDIQSPSANVSARRPKFSPNGLEITYVGYTVPVSVDQVPSNGKIVRQFFGQPEKGIEDPPDAPVADPLPDAPPTGPADNANITFQGSFGFDRGQDGWRFDNAGFDPSLLNERYERIDDLARELESGIIGLYAGAESALINQDAQIVSLRFQALQSSSGGVNLISNNPRRTVAQDLLLNDLPTDVENGIALRGGELTNPRVYISPATPVYQDGEQVVVNVRIETNDYQVGAVRAYLQYDTTKLAFVSGTTNSSLFPRKLRDGSLTLEANNSNSVFGFWGGPESSIQVVPDSLYLYRARVGATAGTPASQVPTLRLRANSVNLESAFTQETNSFGDLTLSPNSEETKLYDLLFKPPSGFFNLPSFQHRYILSFDLLNFLQEDSPNGGLTMYDVEIYRMDDKKRYYAVWGFEVPPGGSQFTFDAIGASGVNTTLSAELRRCCSASTDVVDCVTGNTITGVQMDFLNTALPPGFYTLVIATDIQQDIILTWEAPQQLLGNLGESCSGVIPSATFCDQRVVLEGNGRDDNFVLEPSVVTPFYDGAGKYEGPGCSTTVPNSVIKQLDEIYTADMSNESSREEWAQGPLISPFGSPDFVITDSSLAMSITNPENNFGFWNADGSSIGLSEDDLITTEGSPNLIFRGSYLITNKSEFNRLALPDIRVRLASSTFQRSVSAVLVSLTNGATSPAPADAKFVEVYMVMDQAPDSLESLVAAFDLLSFYTPAAFPNKDITDELIELELVRVERAYIPNYPMP